MRISKRRPDDIDERRENIRLETDTRCSKLIEHFFVSSKLNIVVYTLSEAEEVPSGHITCM